MLSVSLYVELLRSNPRAIFWLAALTQAALWTLVPALFYAAPPGQVAELLAIGHQFRFGGDFGPPLAYWLAEIAFRAAGMTGVYLLAQLCVLTAYWAVFALGRVVVGERHAAIAVLLMVGISVFTVPSPDFGPGLLALALWALVLAHYWQASGDGKRVYWYAVGCEIALLLYTSDAGLVLVGLLLVFTVATAHGRAQLLYVEPWIGGVIAYVILFPYLIWIDQHGSASLARWDDIAENLRTWEHLIVALVLSHAGLVVLLALGYGFPFARQAEVPVVERRPAGPQARLFVFTFTLAPVMAIGLLAFATGRPDAFAGPALVVLSGLAAIVAAPDRIRFVHQKLIAAAWVALLVLPPLAVAASVVLLPWTLAIDLRVSQPADELGRYFGDTFARRTGRPLAVVAGDQRLASLIALSAPSRPSLFFAALPERTPWVTMKDIEEKGAVIVWPATDTRGLPPAAIRERFPNLVPELPRGFERSVQGRLPLLRIGWAVIRPRAQ